MIYIVRTSVLGLSFCYTLFSTDILGAETYLFSFVLVTNSLWITRLCREDGDIIIATGKFHSADTNSRVRHVFNKSAIGFLAAIFVGCIFVANENIALTHMILFSTHLFLTFGIMLIGLYARSSGSIIIASAFDVTGARWILLLAAALIGWSTPDVKENTDFLLYQAAIGLLLFVIYKLYVVYHSSENENLIGPSLTLQLYNLLLPKLFEITSFYEQFIFYKSLEIFLLIAKIRNFAQTFEYKINGYEKNLVFWITIIGLIISYMLTYIFASMAELEFFKYICELSIIEFFFSMCLLLVCVYIYILVGPVDYLFYEAKSGLLVKSYIALILFSMLFFAVSHMIGSSDWIAYLLLLAPAIRRIYVARS